MDNTTKVEFQAAGATMCFETGQLARQADGAVMCSVGDNVLFSAVSSAKEAREGTDFFPLQVEYREKFYASGRFPGGYFKREARPSEKEVLTMRVTDRPIRTLFPDGFYREVQINNTLLSCDGETETDVMSINASSAALTISELPFQGPIGAVRVGRIHGEFVLAPTHKQLEESDLDLTYAGMRDLPLMIEGNANEVSEEDFVAAMKLAHAEVVKIIDAQLELRKKLGLPEKKVEAPERETAPLDHARELAAQDLDAAMDIAGKQERQDKLNEIKARLQEDMIESFPEMADGAFEQMFDQLEVEIVEKRVVERKARIGNRGLDDIRELEGFVGILPRTHGSAVFRRGDTQALAITTLAGKKESQSLDAVTGGAQEKTFLLHYNFPPYCVGEVGRLGTTKRREIGHGNLAERSLKPMLPEDYPYAVRVVSEIMDSNGSSSMATICAGTLSLMDAGVPMRSPVAGISVGLFGGQGDRPVLVTDILGAEDHCGDMDFKVAGTRNGITGFQVDLKIPGLRWELVEQAFAKAREARLKILDAMTATIAEPRAEISPYAPQVKTVQIDTEKIGALIGPGGKNIRRITDTYDVQIDIEEDGTVNLYSADKDAMESAIKEVEMATAEAEVGKIYEGRVVTVREFGAFVEILPGKEGLVHISELADYRVGKVEDICKEGDAMRVKCIDIDQQGRVRLSRRAAMEEEGGEKE
ncbi:polyribonucleotide nucleotidyltransferase [Kiritimatiella glycovorans]|uniref:Polyribonucleotide nucleotidyltransferase n=1 Tax=Kiritimatiella glycovorans TaxID=1307763 RepID=A0A0G3EL86_9BACT|nr:polyribonucleotide nucleotidyltransferase [Kiritimatiella glycovorans]AKJ64894.1 Polyribonucleotide nucleotidyltransferase [Kiritimatiella glycovorans]